MAKALVIKNADFSANKLTTITFDEEVPCTGISFDSASITIDSLGQVSIPYTVTPSNTTDVITFESSNTSVLSVDGGVITANGIGTATLTVRCGRYSDTCEVTVNIVENPVFAVGFSDDTTDGSNEGVLLDGSSRSRIFAAESYADGHFSNELGYINKPFDVETLAPIRIPQNVTKIHIEATGLYDSTTASNIKFFTSDETYVKGSKTYMIYTSEVSLTPVYESGTRYINTDVDIPTGAIGFLVTIRVSPSAPIEAYTSYAELKAGAENSYGVSISYK